MEEQIYEQLYDLPFRAEVRKRWQVRIVCGYCKKEDKECNCDKCALCEDYLEADFLNRMKVDGEDYELVCDFCLDKGREYG